MELSVRRGNRIDSFGDGERGLQECRERGWQQEEAGVVDDGEGVYYNLVAIFMKI